MNYRDDPRVSQSTLKNYWISAKYGDYMAANPKAPTSSMQLGTLVHDIVLMGDVALEKYRTDSPINETTGYPFGMDTKKYLIWKTEVILSGCMPANPSFISKARMMVGSLTPRARELIAACDHIEEPIFWEQDGIGRKGKPDAWKTGDYLVEIKTTRQPLNSRALQRVVMTERYGLQCADYRNGIGTLGRTCIIWLSEAGGGDCAVTWLNESWLDHGTKQVQRALANYAKRGQMIGQAPEEIEIDLPEYLEEFTLTSEQGEEFAF